jgi:hypothetical protein
MPGHFSLGLSSLPRDADLPIDTRVREILLIITEVMLVVEAFVIINR